MYAIYNNVKSGKGGTCTPGSPCTPSQAPKSPKSPKGFTLIEILIVVIILGILAAIVIPQFSSASSDARKSSLQSTVQTLRSQIALYKLQHNDKLPNLTTSWDPMVKTTDVTGTVVASGTANSFGPYMQAIPVNPLTSTATPVVKDGTYGGTAVTGADYVYDYNGGAGSGNIWGSDNTTTGHLLP